MQIKIIYGPHTLKDSRKSATKKWLFIIIIILKGFTNSVY